MSETRVSMEQVRAVAQAIGILNNNKVIVEDQEMLVSNEPWYRAIQDLANWKLNVLVVDDLNAPNVVGLPTAEDLDKARGIIRQSGEEPEPSPTPHVRVGDRVALIVEVVAVVDASQSHDLSLRLPDGTITHEFTEDALLHRHGKPLVYGRA